MNAHPPSRLGRFALVAALSLVLLGIGLSIIHAGEAPTGHRHRPSHSAARVSVEDEVEAARADAQRATDMRRDLLERIAPLAARDAEVAMLRDFFDRQAIPAGLIAGHMYIPPSGELVDREGFVTEQMFFFVVTSLERLERLGLHPVSPYEFTPERELRFVPGAAGDLMAISSFIHELRHAYDRCTGLEPDSEIYSDTWIEGEYRAYTLQIRVLDLMTDGRFSALASDFARSATVPAGLDAIPTVTDREAEALERFSGPYLSEIDRMFRTGVLLLAANFARNESLGLGHDGDVRSLRELQRASLEAIGINPDHP